MADITVTIPGVGDVDFPDSMSQEDITAAVKKIHQTSVGGLRRWGVTDPSDLSKDTKSEALAQRYIAATTPEGRKSVIADTPVGGMLHDLVDWWTKNGPQRVKEGAIDALDGSFAQGTHKMLTGAGTTLLPLAVGPALAHPIMGAAAIAAGAAGDAAGNYGGRAMGLTPDQAAVAGDVAGLGIGAVGGVLGSKVGLSAPSRDQVITGLQFIRHPARTAIKVGAGALADALERGKAPDVTKLPPGMQPRPGQKAPSLEDALKAILEEARTAQDSPDTVTLPPRPGADMTPGGTPSVPQSPAPGPRREAGAPESFYAPPPVPENMRPRLGNKAPGLDDVLKSVLEEAQTQADSPKAVTLPAAPGETITPSMAAHPGRTPNRGKIKNPGYGPTGNPSRPVDVEPPTPAIPDEGPVEPATDEVLKRLFPVEDLIPASKSSSFEASGTPGLSKRDLAGVGADPSLRVKSIVPEAAAEILLRRAARQGGHVSDYYLKQLLDLMQSNDKP